jgi:hypothetical protein
LVISIKHHHLLSRPDLSGLRRAINQCSRPKAGDLFCYADQLAAQRAFPDRCVYHMIAAKNCTHLCRGEHYRHRHVAAECAHLSASTFRSIECEEENSGFFGTHGLADLFGPSNRNTSPAGETDQIAATLYK